MKTLRSRRHRGQAAVELALLSLIIIPVFLYIIFLDDLLRFKQDQQEAIIASTWDFTTLNYDHQTQTSPSKLYIPASGSNSHITVVQTFNRYSWADHTSATPRFEDKTGKGEYHHLAVGAHQCWIVGGLQNQVTCTQVDQNMAANFVGDLTGAGITNARIRVRDFVHNGTGGQYQCTGRVGVINNYLPSGNLWGFSNEELTRTKFHGKQSDNGSIDFNGTGVHSFTTASEAYHFPADTFSVVTHPWAMTDQNDVSPTDMFRMVGAPFSTSMGTVGVPLYDRVVQVYNSGGPMGFITAATQYPIQAISQQLISPLVVLDLPIGDLMLTPEVAFRKAYDPKVGNFYSSQYVDWQGNDVQKHYNARRNWYLGSKNQP